MNEEMQLAWLEISEMLGGEPTREELDVFLRTWQRAAQAERNRVWTQDHWAEYERGIRNATLDEIAKKIEAMPFGDTAASFAVWIREQKS
jgi:hypothetical protein